MSKKNLVYINYINIFYDKKLLALNYLHCGLYVYYITLHYINHVFHNYL